MINPPLRQVLTFVRLAETGSFRRAAERLGISQPAVSAHIASSNVISGFRWCTARPAGVVDRGRQGVRNPCPPGARRVGSGEPGPARAGYAPSRPRGRRLHPADDGAGDASVIVRLERDYPAVEVDIRDVLSGQVEQLVTGERVMRTTAIGPRPQGGDLLFEEIERDYFVAAVPRSHALAAANGSELGELASFPILTVTRDANARHILDRAIQKLRSR